MTEKAVAVMMTLSRSAKYFKASVNSNMSSDSDLWKRSLFGSASDGYGQCCPPVFDPSALFGKPSFNLPLQETGNKELGKQSRFSWGRGGDFETGLEN